MTFKIGYFADGPWSHLALEKILVDPGLSIEFVCARFDKPDNVLDKIAADHGLPFLIHKNINSDDFIEKVGAYYCDIFVSMSFNQIFKERLINVPPRKTINCHAGKLPFYRGRNILNWALINDEKEFGITVHFVDKGIDTGDVILQKCFPITDDDNYSTLLDRAYVYCADILYEAIKQVQRDDYSIIKQSALHSAGFYCSARKEGDEVINWNSTSRELFNFVRAICRPGPEARTSLNGKEIRINKIELDNNAPIYKGIPGAILGVEPHRITVKTLDSYVHLTEWSSLDKFRVGDRFK